MSSGYFQFQVFLALAPTSLCGQVSVRGLPLLLVVGGLGILLGLGNTHLPWGPTPLPSALKL